MELGEYLQSLKSALPGHFVPDGIYHGKEGALRLAREVGHGLACFPEDEVKKVMNSLYSDLLVRHTFGHGDGVPIDSKEWADEILGGMKRW